MPKMYQISIDSTEYRPEAFFKYKGKDWSVYLDPGMVQPTVDVGTAQCESEDIDFSNTEYKKLQKAITEHANKPAIIKQTHRPEPMMKTLGLFQ